MTQMKGGFSNLLAPGIKKVVSDSYRQYLDEYTKLFNMDKTDRSYETTLTVEGLGIAERKNEGAPINFKELTQGYSKNWTNLTYGLGMSVTKEMYDDDLYGIMKKGAKYLGRSIRLAIENAAASILNNGFDSSYTGPDAEELFSRHHPWASGGTGSNTLSVATALSATSLQVALSEFESTSDSAGSPIVLIPKTIYVPSELRWDVSVILNSQKKSGTANNDINPITKELSLDYVINHYFTDSDSWFIKADVNELLGLERQKPMFENDDDFKTGDALFKVTARYIFGWADWVGMFGVKGPA